MFWPLNTVAEFLKASPASAKSYVLQVTQRASLPVHFRFVNNLGWMNKLWSFSTNPFTFIFHCAWFLLQRTALHCITESQITGTQL